jgi:amidohydrolase
MDIKAAVNDVVKKAIDWRHQIHMNPELGYKEYETSALVEKVLTEAGIEVTKFEDSTAVLGVLKGGKPGKVIALRADMDALPIQELTDVDYKSKNDGVMHACGHDIHTAVLMGVATALAANKEEVPGTVKFLFQPAEEVPPGGAKFMVEDGVLKNPDADYVFGLHSSTNYLPGHVEIISGYSHANTDGCTIKIIGNGAHGAYPHKGIDAVHVAGHVIVGLHSIISRSLDPLDSGVVTIGSVHSGTVNNIIAETAEMLLTVRTLTDEAREKVKNRIIEVTENTAKAHGAKAEVDYWYGYPSLYNSEEGVEIVTDAAKNVLPKDKIHYRDKPGMGGEDFAYFLQEVTGAFFYLGTKTEGDDYPGHNPRFNPSDEGIQTGIEMMLSVVLTANER